MASMMILGLGICASSSSVSSVLGGGGAFAFIKKRQADAAAAAEAKRKAEAAAAAKRRAAAARRAREAAAARRRAAAARRQAERRRREQAAARQRAIAARAKRIRRKPKLRKIGRRFKRAFRRIRKPKLRRIGRRFKRAFKRRRGGKTGRKRGGKTGRKRRRRCFSPETPIKLQDGNTVSIKDLKLGDVLTNGSIVNATMQIRNEGDKYYRIHSKELDTDILVTGSHYIRDSNKYVKVQNFKESRSTDIVDTVVSCVITNDHRIPVGEHIFWDWEDQKVNL